MRAGVHAQSQAGIHGDSREDGGAFSICISEGYEDNRDNGDRMYVSLLHPEPHVLIVPLSTYVGSGMLL